jgi:hypothetical protein
MSFPASRRGTTTSYYIRRRAILLPWEQGRPTCAEESAMWRPVFEAECEAELAATYDPLVRDVQRVGRHAFSDGKDLNAILAAKGYEQHQSGTHAATLTMSTSSLRSSIGIQVCAGGHPQDGARLASWDDAPAAGTYLLPTPPCLVPAHPQERAEAGARGSAEVGAGIHPHTGAVAGSWRPRRLTGADQGPSLISGHGALRPRVRRMVVSH